MKKILFLGLTEYNLEVEDSSLRKKFRGLAQEMKIFVVARGKLGHKKIYQSDFYLIPRSFFIFWYVLIFFVSLYLILIKKIDIIICQSPLFDGVLGVILKKLTGRELIIEIHGDWIEAPEFYHKIMKRKMCKWLGEISLKNTDKIRVVSHYLEVEAKKIAPDKIYFCFPAWMDLSDIRYQMSDVRYILFVGSFYKIKGVEYLIDAFAKIKDEFPSLKLILVGSGPEENFYKLQVMSYKLEKFIKFTGQLSQKEVRYLMGKCSILVLPSLSEGFGRVLIEVMALGKPVIGSNVGGIPEIIKDGENGFLCPSRDVNCLAEKMKAILSDEILAQKIGENGKKNVLQNFSPKKYFKSYKNLVAN